MTTISVQARRRNQNAKLIADTFLSGQELPFAEVLPANLIEAVFRKHDAWFGRTYNAIYNTAIVLWAFLSQTLSDGKSRSCSAAVMRIIAFLMSVGKMPPSTNTGDFCGVLPRRICFTRTCVYLLTLWSQLALGLFPPETLQKILAQIATLKIPDRPHRIEPRVLKRRPHPYKLMTEPPGALQSPIFGNMMNCTRRGFSLWCAPNKGSLVCWRFSLLEAKLLKDRAGTPLD